MTVNKKAIALTKGAIRIVSGGNGSGNEPPSQRNAANNGLGNGTLVALSVKPAGNEPDRSY